MMKARGWTEDYSLGAFVLVLQKSGNSRQRVWKEACKLENDVMDFAIIWATCFSIALVWTFEFNFLSTANK